MDMNPDLKKEEEEKKKGNSNTARGLKHGYHIKRCPTN